MQIRKQSRDAYAVEATVVLETAELQTYVDRARKLLSSDVDVEGFRKGKAPEHLREAKLSDATVRQAALEVALEESFTKAAQEEGWDVAHTSELKVVKNDPGGLEYSVLVHLWPAVKLADLGTVKVPGNPVDVSETEIDEAFETVRNMRATFLDKTGAAALGDRVEVDFDSTLNGTPIEGGSSRNHPLILGGKTFMPGFEEELVGLVPQATKRFALTAPANYYEANLAGKSIDFTVTIQRVQAVLKPTADDSFAKSLGSFENIDQLRGSLRDGIYREKSGKERQRVRLAILDAITAASDIPTPTDMVTTELDGMVHRFSHDLESRGMQLPMYLSRLNKTQDQLREEWRPEAERQVRILLALRTVAQEKGIQVSEGELEEAVRQTVAEIVRSGQAAQEQVDTQRVRGMLAEQLLRDRTLEFLEGVCLAV